MLQIMETPGRTPESISVLVFEHAGDPVPYGVLFDGVTATTHPATNPCRARLSA